MEKEHLEQTKRYIELLHSKSEGVIYIANTNEKGGDYYQKAFDIKEKEDIYEHIEWRVRRDENVYITIGAFNENRSVEDLSSLHCFICEYDAKEGVHGNDNQPFDTIEQSLKEIEKKYTLLGLKPTVINSGGGIHCIFHTTDNLARLEPNEYSNICEALFQAGLPEEKRFEYYNECKDTRRILRIPGTWNYFKRTKEYKLCFIVCEGEAQDSSVYINAVKDLTKEVKIRTRKTRPTITVTPSARNGIEYLVDELQPWFRTFLNNDDLKHPKSGKTYTSTSEKDQYLIGYLCRFGWTDIQIDEYFRSSRHKDSHYFGKYQGYDYIKTSINNLPLDNYEELVKARDLPFAKVKDGNVRIDKDALLYFYDGRLNTVLDDYVNINQTIRVYNGKIWKVVDDRGMNNYINMDFKDLGVVLNPVNIDMLRKTIKNNEYRITYRRVDKNWRKEIAIAFVNGTLYIDSEKKGYHFVEGAWKKEDLNLFSIDVDYTDDLMSMDWRNNEIIGKGLIENYTKEDLYVIQRYLGSILVPEYNIEQVLIIIGKGGSGKSTLVDTITSLFTEGSVSATNVSQWGGNHVNVSLMNSILNISNEITDRQVKSDIFRQIIAQDEIEFNPKFQDVVKAKPFAKHIFAVNDLPNMSPGYEIARRILYAETLKIIPISEQKAGYKMKWIENKRVLLAFMLQGLMDLVKNGFPKIINANDKMFYEQLEQSDPLTDYVLNYLTPSDNGNYLPVKMVCDNIQVWREANHIRLSEMNNSKMGKRLNKIFSHLGMKDKRWNDIGSKIRSVKGEKVRVYEGIKIKITEDEKELF